MIEDLQGTGDRSIDAQIAIVGGGTAGLVMATQLAQKGFSVVCLESGQLSQPNDTHPLNDAVHTKLEYSGAAHGRFRCAGGTSTRWGGALIPFMESDIKDADWPIAPDKIHEYAPRVESLFGLTEGPYEQVDFWPNREEHSHVARAAKWPAFNRRNVFHLLESQIRSPGGPRMFLNATVTDFHIENSHLQGVIARAPDRSTITVRAAEFIFAAGAIETTRLLLLLNRQMEGRLDTSGHLGRHFYDHLSSKVASLDVIDRNALNRLAGFRFEPNGTLRNLRFELSENSVSRGSIRPCFVHIAFADDAKSGFHALREIFRNIQQGARPPMSTLYRLARATPWLLRAVWWRFYERRLLYPQHAELQLHLVIEQIPSPDNRITLSEQRTDIFGTPLPQIEWLVQPKDMQNMEAAIDDFELFWKSSGLDSLARINRRPSADIEAEIIAGAGIYHPGGSTRMAGSPESGVVDTNLRAFGVDNLTAVSTSVFPTGGGSNPTMMLMMFALRCVDDVSARLSHRSAA